jgi:transposase
MAKKGSIFKKYSPEFKLRVVEAYLSGKYGGLEGVTKAFEMKSKTQIREWVKHYQDNGVSGLSLDKRTRGNNPLAGKYFRERNIETWPLEQQVEYLKMENTILKKVKALRLKK